MGAASSAPVDSITLEQPEPTVDGAYDSDHLKWVGKSRSGATEHRANWRANVRVESPGGRSSFVLQNGMDEAGYENRLEVAVRGDVELPTAGAAVILRSPNGKTLARDRGRFGTVAGWPSALRVGWLIGKRGRTLFPTGGV